MTELQESAASRNENALARPALVLSVISLALTGIMIFCFVLSKFAAALGFLVYLALVVPLASMPIAMVAIVLGALGLRQARTYGSRAAALHAVIYGVAALLLPTIGFAISAGAGS